MEASPSTASTTSTIPCLQDFSTHQLLEEVNNCRHGSMIKAEKRIIFIGAPGCGKGTQSTYVKDRFHLGHLSTGDMLREAVAAQTPLGILAKEIMAKGQLVDDDLVLGLVKNKIAADECKGGFLLDGFPRNVTQAALLDELLRQVEKPIDVVIYFEISDSLLLERVCGRRVHLPSGRVYHVKFNPPRVADIDDVTGEVLTHRKDDNEETLKKRLDVFHSETIPVIEFYEK